MHNTTQSSPGLHTHKLIISQSRRSGKGRILDHHLVIGAFSMKLSGKRIVGGGGRRRIKHSYTREQICSSCRGCDVDTMWQQRKGVFADTCREVLGYRETTIKKWLSDDILEARREVKQ